MQAGFKLFGIPVQVSLFFFLIVYLLGGEGTRRSPILAVAWVVVAFVGVLLHELAHALVVRAFGGQPSISFEGFGGLTSWSPTVPLSPGKHLLIAIAGPGVGIVVGFAALVLRTLLTAEGSMAHEVMWFVVFVNLGWGLLNLLPMLPMDGGKVMASLFAMASGGGGVKTARIVSLILALLLAGLSLLAREIFFVLFFGLFAWLNYQALQVDKIQRLAAAEAAALERDELSRAPRSEPER